MANRVRGIAPAVKGIPSGRSIPASHQPVDAERIPLGRLKQKDVTGAEADPIMRSRQLLPNTPLLDRPAIHRNKTMMKPTKGY